MLLLITLIDFPLHALTVNGDLTKHFQVKPGDVFEVKFTVANNKDKPEDIILKQSDYRYNSSGENFFEEPGSLPRSNASWIHLDTPSLRLNPGESKEIIYTVAVPKQNSLNGSYSSLILIEPSAPAAEILQNNSQFNLQVMVRYAHQIITTLPPAKYGLRLLSESIENNDDGQRLTIDVENTGTAHLFPKLNLKLFDKNGKQSAELIAKPQNIFPQNSVRYFLPLQPELKGNYLGLLLFDAGHGQIFAEKIHLVVP